MASRRKRLWIGVAAVLVVLIGGAGYGVWWGSGQSVEVVHYGAGSDSVLASGNGTVTFKETAKTSQPGTYWFEWSGAHTMVGDIVARTPGRVTRKVVGGAVPSVGSSGYFGAVPPGDPKVTWDIDFSEIMVKTELGEAPAWYVPGKGDTWVIAVHGQNGRRKAELSVVPVVHRLGLPVLVVSYRNDEGAPASPDGLLHLGDSEWRDLEAAVRTAQGMGARRIVIYGTSMGGVIAGQFLDRSRLAGTVSGVIMDAPPYDFDRVAAWSVQKYHLPGAVGWLSNRVAEWRTGISMDRLNLLSHPPAVRPRMLLIHTDADLQAPVQASRDLAAAGGRLGWEIRYEEFKGGDHVEAWNVDRARYDRLVGDFLAPFATT
ncbi:prolyl oligopeptidase family serine peptidase [Nonomuraea sp. NPDC050556]|uniref:alpha/beta hydrolase family protein n=1 Tax=Nonomuraea sp. NPDC050556 TaxID=3364369 RepID=UPI00379889D3